jgi:hypothetical protein
MQTFGKWRPALPALVALAFLAGAGPARASFMLELSEPGFAPLVILDNEAGLDSDSTVGKIVYKNGYGDFTVDTSVTGVSNSTNPSLGNGSVGELQITSLVVRNNSTGTKSLTVLLGDTGFTFPGSTGDQMTLRSSIGVTFLQGSVGGDDFTFQSYADTGNIQFGTGVTTGAQTFTFSGQASQNALSGDATPVTFTQGIPYSLTNSSTFTMSPTGQVNTSGTTSVIAAAAAVPEPASLALGATGFVLVGLCGWRARRRQG